MDDRSISKYISLVLRHDPSAAHVELDAGGWVDIELLLAGAKKARRTITREELLRVVKNSDKQRFVIREGKIRANQGHSLNIDLGLQSVQPPAVLYHGTASAFVDAVLEKGLLKMKRQHVHLSADQDTARRVGARHGKPVILIVDAARMFEEGSVFLQSENKVWLTDHVLPRYLSVQAP